MMPGTTSIHFSSGNVTTYIFEFYTRAVELLRILLTYFFKKEAMLIHTFQVLGITI